MVLVSPPHSPVLQPINGASKQEPINGASKHELINETSVVKETPISKDQAPFSGVENLPPSHVRVSFHAWNTTFLFAP